MLETTQALEPEYVPETLHHREGKADRLMNALAPLSHGSAAEDVFVHGPSGAGKTTLARHALRRINEEAAPVTWGYANCIGDSTPAGVYHALLQSSGVAPDLRREGTATGTLLERLRGLSQPFVAVVDEVDALAEPDVLATLYECRGLSTIAITVDGDAFLAGVSERVRSRVRSAVEISLPMYRQRELADILEARADGALGDGRVTDDALAAIADRAAGDARLGIAILRQAARDADERDRRTIDVGLVDEVEGDARRELRERHVDTLGTHQRILFEIVREAGEIAAGELHDRYEARADDPRSRGQRRRYLGSLGRYGLLEQRGSGRGSRYALVED